MITLKLRWLGIYLAAGKLEKPPKPQYVTGWPAHIEKLDFLRMAEAVDSFMEKETQRVFDTGWRADVSWIRMEAAGDDIFKISFQAKGIYKPSYEASLKTFRIHSSISNERIPEISPYDEEEIARRIADRICHVLRTSLPTEKAFTFNDEDE